MGKMSRAKKLKPSAADVPLRNYGLLKDISQEPAFVQGVTVLVFVGLCILLFYPPYLRAMFFTRDQLPTHLLTYTLFILWWVVKYLRRDGFFLRGPLDYVTFGFLLAYVLSFTVAINIRGATQEFLKVGNYFLVYWLVAELGRVNKGAPIILLNVLVLSALGVAVVGLGAAAGSWVVRSGFDGGRISSTIQYPNSLAAYLTGAFLVSVALWQTAKWKLRSFYALAAFLLLVTAVLTYSRGGWLIMPVFFLLYVCFAPAGRRLDAAMFIGGALAAAVGVAVHPGRAAGGVLWLLLLAGCLAVLAVQHLLIDLRKRLRVGLALAAAGLLAVLLVAGAGGYVVYTLRAPLRLAQSGVEQLIAVSPDLPHTLSMEVLATQEGEVPFAWQLTVTEQRAGGATDTLLQAQHGASAAWEKKQFAFTTSPQARRVVVQIHSVHPGTSLAAREVSLTADGQTRELDFAWNRLLPAIMYSRLFGLDREQNVQGRLVFFQDAWKIIREHPWLGLGGHAWSSVYFKYQSAQYSTTEVHNHFLQVWIETGLIGFLLFVGIWLAFVLISYRLHRGATPEQKVLVTGIAAGVLAVVAHSVYDFNLSLGAIGVFLFALMGITRSLAPEQRQAATHNMIYKPVLAATVALGLTVFVAQLMTANAAMEEGMRWMGEGQFPRGMQAFVRAVQFDPYDAQMRLFLAEAYEQMGMQTEEDVFFTKAREQYTAALNSNRYHPRFAHALGGFLIRSGYFDQGLSYLQRTIARHPGFVGHHRVYANACITAGFFSLQDDDQAAARGYLERVFAADRRVQEQFADPASLAFAVGQAHFMLDNMEQAAAYLERAVNVAEDQASALMMLSLVQQKNGNSARATELHAQAIALDPASESIYQAFKDF